MMYGVKMFTCLRSFGDFDVFVAALGFGFG